MSDSENPDVPEDKNRIWRDSDDENEVKIDEPQWLKKRRTELKEELGEREEDQDKRLKFSGALTRIKPTKFKSGVRFKITHQQASKEPIRINGGVREIKFDQDCKYMSILGYKEKGIKLYHINASSLSNKSKSENRLKLNRKKELNFSNFVTTGSCFKNDNILITGRNKKLLKYNILEEKGTDIFSVTVPENEKAFKGICASDRLNLYAISCVNTGTLLVCDFNDNVLTHNFKMGSECIIYEFDLVAGKCRQKFKDAHSHDITSFSVWDAEENGFYATGTKSGYVQLYNLNTTRAFKEFDNITTEITSVCATEEFTLFSSIHKKNGLRVVYNRGYNVVANWPNNISNLGRISTAAFCRQSDTIVTGTRSGRVQFHKILK
ncbi:uncharacterized protein TOT_020000801 [Theileria orientalis strain Shintoku]|uniref:Uncharacterized protein n=1 Tax=Theileria orientalis strain Shintoku TaxID=869250 RepID=J4C3J4_THEOR|nr:uncharacterized protein TOT_020000801 [Theileria orientalis strain Shintoku]PVC50669.1 hypothetical protein MACL_00002104 [Theileria orientalis]BAM40546.1 uncharacterized protein TOT_020000801 [Theileria orientalis strain Shintoku]|eukprot:XP_009690847.1 uncharacterized protein TOT_020000801 [Theileria orientalis strain Shintoku]